MDDIGMRIGSYIASELASSSWDGGPLSQSTKLLGRVLDSFGLMQLTSFLEEEFGIVLEDADLDPSHFRTLGDLETLVRRKRCSS